MSTVDLEEENSEEEVMFRTQQPSSTMFDENPAIHHFISFSSHHLIHWTLCSLWSTGSKVPWTFFCLLDQLSNKKVYFLLSVLSLLLLPPSFQECTDKRVLYPKLPAVTSWAVRSLQQKAALHVWLAYLVIIWTTIPPIKTLPLRAMPWPVMALPVHRCTVGGRILYS